MVKPMRLFCPWGWTVLSTSRGYDPGNSCPGVDDAEVWLWERSAVESMEGESEGVYA